MSDPQISSLLSGQIIRSGQHGQYLITRETVEDMHRQLQERPVPVNIEHDPTVPPVGRITDSRLVELEDGELALETDTEIFDGTVPAALYAHSDLASAVQALEHLPAEPGPVDVIVDDRSYSKEDLEALRVIIAEVGGANARDGALRFSQLPDALLVFSLGSTGTAMFWFSKGFFTKLGERTAEELGEEVGKDLAGAYRALKTKVREVVARRNPPDQPPLTMFTLTIGRADGGTVEIEGSTRAGDAGLDDFLDAGEELLAIARVFVDRAPEPATLAKMHFAREDGTWHLRYGLDDQARPVMIVALSDEEYARAKAVAQQEH